MMEFLPITALRNDGLQMLLSILYSLVLSVIFVPVMVISSNRNSNSARIVVFFVVNGSLFSIDILSFGSSSIQS